MCKAKLTIYHQFKTQLAKVANVCMVDFKETKNNNNEKLRLINRRDNSYINYRELTDR